MIDLYKEQFDAVCEKCFQRLGPDEKASALMTAEQSTFIRFSHNKIRQNTYVDQASIGFTIHNTRTQVNFEIGFSDTSIDEIFASFAQKLSELKQLPDIPNFPVMKHHPSTKTISEGSLLNPLEFEKILKTTEGLDFVGYYQGGPQLVLYANSEGTQHTFAKETFALDYSVFFEHDRSIKGSYAGNQWDDAQWAEKLKMIRLQEEAISREEKVLSPGDYRVYIAPAGVEEMQVMFNWHGFSEREFQNQTSAWLKMRKENLELSPLFSLQEDMSLGLSLPFSMEGEPIPEKIEIVKNGKLENTLIDTKIASEYNLESNGAFSGGYTISPHVLGGNLKESEILEKLGTGVYLSNLHYLNWSDPANLRITGMTRYACFWVEDGKIVAPIKHMRFDDSFTRIFGTELEDLTEKSESLPNIGTYESRGIQGCALPGLLLKSFRFTL